MANAESAHEIGNDRIAGILLVDDQPLVRQGMKYIIGAQPDLQWRAKREAGPRR